MNKTYTAIIVTLTEDLTTKQRGTALRSIGKLSGIFKAAMMEPGEKKFAWAYSDETRKAKDVIADIKHVPGVKSAEIPPARYAA